MRPASAIFPTDMPERRYYVPAPRGLEIKIGEALGAPRAPPAHKTCVAQCRCRKEFPCSIRSCCAAIFREWPPSWRAAVSCSTSSASRRSRSGARPRRSRPIVCARSATPMPRRRARPSRKAGMRRRCSRSGSPSAQHCGARKGARIDSSGALEPAVGPAQHPPCQRPRGRDESGNIEVRRWGEPRGIRLRAQGSRGPRRASRHGFRGGRPNLRRRASW